MTIGMIVAMPEEMESFLSGIGTAEKTESLPGYEVKSYKINENRIYVVGSGAGEIAAAASAQMLITKYDVDMIVNFGVVGGLTPEMTLSKVVVIDRLVHYDYDASPFYDGLVPGQYPGMDGIYLYPDRRLLELAMSVEPELRPVTCASADKFVEGIAAKSSLHEKFDADICEMEVAGILLTCLRCGVPALFIKAVSDGVTGGAEEFETMIREASGVCAKVVMKLMERL
ncbi:MAG: 5'-methylthioadenosine/S-adenosylhomocysteine nucleosidase [Lachnospiraceae bacterium]|nr:5'-methylthioadenosine/S-adenosylhomocysteine nucleosidase [Lachnospiraceae bacterium]